MGDAYGVNKETTKDKFLNFVSKEQNHKFESGSPRKSCCFRTSVVEPKDLNKF